MNLDTKIDNLLRHVPHGWCSVRKAHTMAALVTALRPHTVVEIGVYAGRSFLPMVLALHEIGAGIAYGIDPYDAKISQEGEIAENAEWWGSFDHKIIEDMFLFVMRVLPEMAPRWAHIRQKSDDFTPPKDIGVLHIDGSHTDAALRDVERYASQVIVGGFVVLDDLLWKTGAVSASIAHLEALGFVERYRMIGKEEGTPFEDNWGGVSTHTEMKTIRQDGIWDADIGCNWLKAEVVDTTMMALFFPPHDVCDMSGAIRFCKRLMPEVDHIVTWSGPVLDVSYRKIDGEWRCIH